MTPRQWDLLIQEKYPKCIRTGLKYSWRGEEVALEVAIRVSDLGVLNRWLITCRSSQLEEEVIKTSTEEIALVALRKLWWKHYKKFVRSASFEPL